MKEEDLKISMAPYRHKSGEKGPLLDQGYFIWNLASLPHDFNWDILEKVRGASGGRLDHVFYLYQYAKLLPDYSRIVEIGAYDGASALAMGMAIRNTNSTIISIDPCFYSLEEKREHIKTLSAFTEYTMSSGMGQDNIYIVLSNIRKAGLEGYITLIPGTSEEVLGRWNRGEIDMLFVDGDHTYSAVKADCGWLRHVKSGGIAVFDDWIEPVKKAVKEYMEQHPEWTLVCESTDQPPDCLWKTVYLKK